MLQGKFIYNIDDKNRLVMPPKFREYLENATITLGYEECLAIYPEEEWKIFSNRLLNMDSSREEARENIRLFIGSAEDVEVDKQNRIKLPQALLLDASIIKECVIIGVINHIEIWGMEAYKRYRENSLKNLSTNTSKLQQGGF